MPLLHQYAIAGKPLLTQAPVMQTKRGDRGKPRIPPEGVRWPRTCTALHGVARRSQEHVAGPMPQVASMNVMGSNLGRRVRIHMSVIPTVAARALGLSQVGSFPTCPGRENTWRDSDCTDATLALLAPGPFCGGRRSLAQSSFGIPTPRGTSDVVPRPRPHTASRGPPLYPLVLYLCGLTRLL